MRTRTFWTAILFFAVATSAWATEPGTPQGHGAQIGAVAVDCAGSYIRIATQGLALGVAARGHLWDGPDSDVLRPAATGRFDGCLVTDAVGDPAGRFLYAAIAREPFFGQHDTRSYRVAALRLPDLELVSFVDLGEVSAGPVSLLLSPDGNELLVSYVKGTAPGAAGAPGPRLLRLPAPTLDSGTTPPLTGARRPVEIAVDTVVSTDARWVEQGRILDGPRVLSDQGEILRRVDPYTTFGRWASGAFPRLVRRGAGGKPYLPLAFAASADNRMVFAVNPDWRTGGAPEGGGLVIYDPVGGGTVAIHLGQRPAAFDPTSRATPTIHLTPDGERVVVEEEELRQPADAEKQERFKTGVLRIYDAVSGSLSRTVSLGTAQGFTARVLGFSRDGRLLFYGSRQTRTVFVVDLAAGEVLAKLDPGPGFDPYSAVSLVAYGH